LVFHSSSMVSQFSTLSQEKRPDPTSCRDKRAYNAWNGVASACLFQNSAQAYQRAAVRYMNHTAEAARAAAAIGEASAAAAEDAAATTPRTTTTTAAATAPSAF
jgi:hypothetical protein